MMSGTLKAVVKVLIVAVVMLPLAACYEHTYTVGSGAPHGPKVYDSWRHHWIGGLISPDQEMELDEVCPSGNATIHEEWTFLNGLVTALTGGIYSPTTVQVRCDRGRRSDLEFSAEDARRIAEDPAFLEWLAHSAPELYQDAAEAQAALDR